MTNKKEHKILRKALSLTLAMLVSILGLPLAKPQQVSATETSDPKFLSSITMDATASTTWSDEGKYNSTFYNEIIKNYDTYTEDNPLKIDSADKLAAFAKVVNDTTEEAKDKDFSGKYVKLTANIDLGGTDPTIEKTTSGDKFSVNITGTASNVWVPIGIKYSIPFKGNFDGGNCEISNMTVLAKVTGSNVYAGLFGYVDGASIKNTGVTGNVYAYSSSSYNSYAGGLVGHNSGSISNSYATGNAYASSSTTSSSDIVAAGGLVGYSSGSISNSYATGNAYACAPSSSYSYSCSYAGGLVGYSDNISNSYATGNAYAYSSSFKACAGGLAGNSDNTISNNYATGNAYACCSSSSSSFVYAGGLVGYVGSGSISNSYAMGNVNVSSTSTKVYGGGLAGYVYIGSVTDSYATGNVNVSSTSTQVCGGGLVGCICSSSIGSSKSSISNSYATGDVSVSSSSSSSSSSSGGLLGMNDKGSIITNSYYYSGSTVDAGTTGTKTSYGTGLTLEQITGNRKGRAKDNMTGFSEDNWEFPGDNGLIKYLPRLKVITYNETTNPAPRLVGIISSDFDFKAPANSTYDGSAKEATVTSEILEIPDDKITVKYYQDENKASPIGAGTYIVKIDVAAGDNYEAQTDITADNWTFTITKADPTINSIATTATYAPSLTLKDVPSPSTTGNTPGSWSWTYPSSSIVAGTYTYSAKYTPTDTTNYNSVAKSITVTVNKADPTIGSTSTTATYKPGLTLAKVSHPSISGTSGSWTWLNSSIPISSAGTHYFEAKFKPTNSNYNEVTKCILVNVSKATLQASDFKFAAPSNLEYSADYKIASVTPNPEIMGMSYPTVKYFTKVNGELTLLEDSSGKLLIPTDVGTYYVGIDVSEDINYNSAKGLTSDSWNFTITPAGKHTYQLADESRVYLVTK